jgi:hypothetical protein
LFLAVGEAGELRGGHMWVSPGDAREIEQYAGGTVVLIFSCGGLNGRVEGEYQRLRRGRRTLQVTHLSDQSLSEILIGALVTGLPE